jgi:hypothetical protein
MPETVHSQATPFCVCADLSLIVLSFPPYVGSVVRDEHET